MSLACWSEIGPLPQACIAFGEGGTYPCIMIRFIAGWSPSPCTVLLYPHYVLGSSPHAFLAPSFHLCLY